VQVTAKTTGKGGDVTLQVRRDKVWVDVDTTTLDGTAQATLEAPAPTAGVQQPMRVVASRDRSVRSDPLTNDDWKVAFDDQFTGDALDLTKWNYRQLGVLAAGSGRTKSESSQDAVSVDNGSLRLGMLKNPARPGYYLNGHIATENMYTFTYGVSAARIKFQKPRGMHGGFWMQAPTFGSVPGDAKASGGEIDAAEYFGSTYPDGGLASFTYYRDKQGTSVKTGGLQPEITDTIEQQGDAWWKKYHVFSVEWTPEAYIFRVDGVETFRQTKNISGVPEFLVLSLLSSDWELPDLDKSKLPVDMKVDWVRVWQQPTP
jgi:beta-glucanase (GH16 family)